MPTKQKKHKKHWRGPRMKSKCVAVKDNLDELQSRAAVCDLDVLVFYPRCCTGNVITIHVCFDYRGERVLNWWPGTGKTWSFDCQKNKADDFDSILELAKETLNRFPGVHLHSILKGD